MTDRQPIPLGELCLRPVHLLERNWMLLAAGDLAAGQYNAMTVSWGFFGNIWNIPCALVPVRPSRYTFGFLQKYPTFTLSALPPAFHDLLDLVGSRSGRNGDKIAAAGLTPQPSLEVAAPSFAEAELVLECRRLYWDDLEKERMVDSRLLSFYQADDIHRMFIGEILAAAGTAAYRSPLS